MAVLFIARLICSDVDCAELGEESVTSLSELDALAGECGCTWELWRSRRTRAPSRPEPGSRLSRGALSILLE